MSMTSTGVGSIGMCTCMLVINMGMTVAGTGVRVTMSTASMRVTMVSAAVLECKDANDVDDEAEDGHNEQPLVVDFGRLEQTLR